MRYAISSAIDRSEICSNAYYNNAVAATGFFNPVFKDAIATQSLNSKANLQITVENLEKIGYNRIANDGSRVNSKGLRPKFTLLVNSENSSRVQAANLIKKQLELAGIEITIISRSYDQYIAALQSGSFQLYLGEISVLPNMDLSPLVLKGGTVSYGVGLEPIALNPDGTPIDSGANITETAINNFYNSSATLSDVAATLLTDMPQIPICYRKGLLFYDSSIKSGVTASESDIYFGAEEYKKK
jgi:peptide/nickel transport system substrate-binding protein